MKLGKKVEVLSVNSERRKSNNRKQCDRIRLAFCTMFVEYIF